MISTRDNSEYKWQEGHYDTILGALEIPCDPEFRLYGDYRSRHFNPPPPTSSSDQQYEDDDGDDGDDDGNETNGDGPVSPTISHSQHIISRQEEFDKALQVWEEWNLRNQFIKAVEQIPKETCCCGLLNDDDSTIKALAPALNKGWIKHINKKLHAKQKGFKLDAFVWQWHNATGKSETNILLIRFFKTT